MSGAEKSELVPISSTPLRSGPTSRELVKRSDSKELFFAVVGHVGSGTSKIAKELEKVLSGRDVGPAFDVEILKARDELLAWDTKHERRLEGQGQAGTLPYARALQDVGDEMRRERSDYAAVAGALIRRIRRIRATKTGQDPDGHKPIRPDGTWRAYILDSVRHPAEAELLARIYQDAFVLIGVVCDEEVREKRLSKEKFRDAGADDVLKFMVRDAKDELKYGQRVSDAFHLAHFFLDNTEARELEGEPNKPNPHWGVADQLSRLKKILTQVEVVRPQVSETAMFAAQGARLRSACLSRQVGASIVDDRGNVVALGTNEVPRAGGGVYGTLEPSLVSEEIADHRCFLSKGYCSNNREQDRIIAEVFAGLGKFIKVDADESLVKKALKDSPIGSLLEFSRAVHAEMDALLSLARRGISGVGTRVFVTTFPCHYCARHLVGAGVDEVQYIEPYPKSRALALHSDAIVTRLAEWVRPSEGGPKVLFRPFVGVAPRLYSRAFTKDRDLKDGKGDFRISPPEWTEPTHLGQHSYVDLETRLAEMDS